MRRPLFLAVLALCLLGTLQVQALVCQNCLCSMPCTQSCRDVSTGFPGQPSTCGAYGICDQSPECFPVFTATGADGDASALGCMEPAAEVALGASEVPVNAEEEVGEGE